MLWRFVGAVCVVVCSGGFFLAKKNPNPDPTLVSGFKHDTISQYPCISSPPQMIQFATEIHEMLRNSEMTPCKVIISLRRRLYCVVCQTPQKSTAKSQFYGEWLIPSTDLIDLKRKRMFLVFVETNLCDRSMLSWFCLIFLVWKPVLCSFFSLIRTD